MLLEAAAIESASGSAELFIGLLYYIYEIKKYNACIVLFDWFVIVCCGVVIVCCGVVVL